MGQPRIITQAVMTMTVNGELKPMLVYGILKKSFHILRWHSLLCNVQN